MGKNKFIKILIAVLVLLFLFFIYTAFTGEPTNDSDVVIVDYSNNGQSEEERQFLQTLQTLQRIDFGDSTIFNDPVFLSLKDFSVEIEKQPVGRNNPFAPVRVSEVFFERFNGAVIEEAADISTSTPEVPAE